MQYHQSHAQLVQSQYFDPYNGHETDGLPPRRQFVRKIDLSNLKSDPHSKLDSKVDTSSVNSRRVMQAMLTGPEAAQGQDAALASRPAIDPGEAAVKHELVLSKHLRQQKERMNNNSRVQLNLDMSIIEDGIPGMGQVVVSAPETETQVVTINTDQEKKASIISDGAAEGIVPIDEGANQSLGSTFGAQSSNYYVPAEAQQLLLASKSQDNLYDQSIAARFLEYQIIPDHHKLMNAATPNDFRHPFLRQKGNPSRNNKLMNMRANTVEKAFFQKEHLADESKDEAQPFVHPNLNRGKYHKVTTRVAQNLRKLRSKVEKKARNFYKVETYEKMKQAQKKEFQSEEPKVTFRDFQREYESLVNFDGSSDASPAGQEQAWPQTEQQDGAHALTKVLTQGSRKVNLSAQRPSVSQSNLIKDGRRMTDSTVAFGTEGVGFQSSSPRYVSSLLTTMKESRQGLGLPASGSLKQLKYIKGQPKNNEWQNLTNEFEKKNQEKPVTQQLPISPRTLARMYRKKQPLKPFGSARGSLLLRQQASGQSLARNGQQQQLQRIDIQRAQELYHTTASRLSQQLIPIKARRKLPALGIEPDKMRVNVSPLKLIQRQPKNKDLPAAPEQNDLTVQTDENLKEEEFIYIAQNSKDLTQEISQQSIMQQMKSNSAQQRASHTFMDKSIMNDKTQLNSSMKRSLDPSQKSDNLQDVAPVRAPEIAQAQVMKPNLAAKISENQMTSKEATKDQRFASASDSNLELNSQQSPSQLMMSQKLQQSSRGGDQSNYPMYKEVSVSALNLTIQRPIIEQRNTHNSFKVARKSQIHLKDFPVIKEELSKVNSVRGQGEDTCTVRGGDQGAFLIQSEDSTLNHSKNKDKSANDEQHAGEQKSKYREKRTVGHVERASVKGKEADGSGPEMKSEEVDGKREGEDMAKYQQIEKKIMEVSERLIAIHQGQKYQGMYKNVLEANRRSHYTKKNYQKYVKKPENDKKNSQSQSPFQKIQPLSSPMSKIQKTRSSRRILDDLSDPQDPKNQYFAKLGELNKNQSAAFKEILEKIEEFKKKEKTIAQNAENAKNATNAKDQLNIRNAHSEENLQRVPTIDQIIGTSVESTNNKIFLQEEMQLSIENFDKVQTMNQTLKNTLVRNSKEGRGRNKDKGERKQDTQRSSSIHMLERSDEFILYQRGTPTSAFKNPTVVRVSQDHTNTTARAEPYPTPHSQRDLDGGEELGNTFNPMLEYGEHHHHFNLTNQSFSKQNFKVSGLKLILQKNVKTAEGKKRGAPNRRTSPGQQRAGASVNSQQESSSMAKQQATRKMNMSSIPVNTLRDRTGGDHSSASQIEAQPYQNIYQDKNSTKILKRNGHGKPEQSQAEQGHSKQQELSIESEEYTQKKQKKSKAGKIQKTSNNDIDLPYGTLDSLQPTNRTSGKDADQQSDEKQPLLSNQVRKNVELSPEKAGQGQQEPHREYQGSSRRPVGPSNHQMSKGQSYGGLVDKMSGIASNKSTKQRPHHQHGGASSSHAVLPKLKSSSLSKYNEAGAMATLNKGRHIEEAKIISPSPSHYSLTRNRLSYKNVQRCTQFTYRENDLFSIKQINLVGKGGSGLARPGNQLKQPLRIDLNQTLHQKDIEQTYDVQQSRTDNSTVVRPNQPVTDHSGLPFNPEDASLSTTRQQNHVDSIALIIEAPVEGQLAERMILERSSSQGSNLGNQRQLQDSSSKDLYNSRYPPDGSQNLLPLDQLRGNEVYILQESPGGQDGSGALAHYHVGPIFTVQTTAALSQNVVVPKLETAKMNKQQQELSRMMQDFAEIAPSPDQLEPGQPSTSSAAPVISSSHGTLQQRSASQTTDKHGRSAEGQIATPEVPEKSARAEAGPPKQANLLYRVGQNESGLTQRTETQEISATADEEQQNQVQQRGKKKLPSTIKRERRTAERVEGSTESPEAEATIRVQAELKTVEVNEFPADDHSK